MKLRVAIYFAGLITSLSVAILSATPETVQYIDGPVNPIPAAFFGMTINGMLRGTPWPAIPFGSLRFWDVSAWAQANPAKGVYNWTELDHLVSISNEHGVSDLLFTFGKVPSWASANPASDCGGLGGTPVDISEISRKGGMVTVRTATNHSRKVGDPVGIGETPSGDFGGGFVVSEVPGPRVFVYRDQREDSDAHGGKAYGFGGCTAGVAHPEDVIPFAKALAQRYCGKIRNYELWNEAGMTHFFDTQEQLASIDRELYLVLKDPNNCGCTSKGCTAGASRGQNPNTVLSPSAANTSVGQLVWLKQYASVPLRESSDVLAFHGYGYSQHPEHLLDGIKRVRAAGGDESMPVWDTEGSWGKATDLSTDKRPGFVAKFYLMHWLSGSSRFYWYSYDNPNLGTLWTSIHGLNIEGVAYRETYKWLVGAVLKRCEVGDNRVSCLLNRSPDYSSQILWSSSLGFEYKIPARFSQYRTLDGQVHRVSSGQMIVITDPIMLETRNLQ